MEEKCFVNGCFGVVTCKWTKNAQFTYSCDLHRIVSEHEQVSFEPFKSNLNQSYWIPYLFKLISMAALFFLSILVVHQYIQDQQNKIFNIQKDIKKLRTITSAQADNIYPFKDVRNFVLNSYYEPDFSLFLEDFMVKSKKAIEDFDYLESTKNLTRKEVFIMLSNPEISVENKAELLYKHFSIVFEEFESEILTIASLDTESEIIYGTMGGSIYYLDLETQGHLEVHQGSSRVYQLVPYSNYQLALVAGDSQIKIMSLYDFEYRQSFIAHQHWILTSKFSSDGLWLATGSCDKLIKVWNATSMREVFTLSGHKGDIWSLGFNHNTKLLASAGEDKTLIVWDLESRSQYLSFHGHKGPIYSLQFTRDSKFIITGSGDGTIRIWNLVDSTSQILAHKGMVRSILLSHYDKYLFTIAGYSLKIWDFEKKTLIHELFHTSTLISLALSYDKTQILTGDTLNRIWVWDLSTYKLKSVFGGSKSRISRIEISEDFQYLAISDAGLVRIYSLYLNLQIDVLMYKEEAKPWKKLFNIDSFLTYLK